MTFVETATKKWLELTTDPEREEARRERDADTGIFVRALRSDGTWDAVCISELDKPSLLAWLQSRGGDNALAENVVAALLGHDGHLRPPAGGAR